jgi:anaerobic selenocysteine-containing dehydrogenase
MARVWNDRASVVVPVKITERLRRRHPVRLVEPPPSGRIANSLTNDTLTERGGGVASSDTLVQVAPADT